MNHIKKHAPSVVVGVSILIILYGCFIGIAPLFPKLDQPETLNTFLAVQANQYSILQIYLFGLSILLAVAAFWGYSSLKTEVEKKTQEVITERVEIALLTLGKIYFNKNMSKRSAGSEFDGKFEQLFNDPGEENE
jgi:hypothetical protein